MRVTHLATLTAVVTAAACSRSSQFSAVPDPIIPNVELPGPALKAARVESFYWPGSFDLVGTGFPDGERRAVMHVRRSDTTYVLADLEGPPGSLIDFRIAGDSAHVTWDLDEGVMVVDLRGARDSVYGQWYIGDRSGGVYGSRRPPRAAYRRTLSGATSQVSGPR